MWRNFGQKLENSQKLPHIQARLYSNANDKVDRVKGYLQNLLQIHAGLYYIQNYKKKYIAESHSLIVYFCFFTNPIQNKGSNSLEPKL